MPLTGVQTFIGQETAMPPAVQVPPFPVGRSTPPPAGRSASPPDASGSVLAGGRARRPASPRHRARSRCTVPVARGSRLLRAAACVARSLRSLPRRGALHDAGMATAEYAVATLAACGFAALLVTILRSAEVRGLLLGIIRRALSVH